MLLPGMLALNNVDYRAWRGKVNVIIGENGAGSPADWRDSWLDHYALQRGTVYLHAGHDVRSARGCYANLHVRQRVTFCRRL